MDHLYNSAAFCKVAFNHTMKILCQGVSQKGMRGMSPSVLRQDMKKKKDQLKVQGTVKATVLESRSPLYILSNIKYILHQVIELPKYGV